MRLSEKILFLRKREGMSQEDLASQLNVSRQTVYKWESDASTPEIEKIKQLATLFNVSFDYLLNDSIVSVEINKAQEEKKEALNKEEPKVPLKEKYRFVFNSNIPMAYRQAELDHGYTESRNNKIPYSEYLFTNRCSQMNKAIKSIGANKSILLQGDLAGCFFENTKDMFFGFYYGGNIQFICPFENFISVHLSDSGNTMSYGHQLATGVGFGSNGIGSIGVVSVAQPRLDNARSYTLIVTYFNKSGNRSEFKLNLNCSRIYPIYERKHVEDVPIIENLESDFTRQRLNEICAVMSSYPVIAKKIADGEVEVKEIKITDIQARIKRAAEDEEEYNDQIEEWTEKDKKRRRIIILSIIAAIVAVILYFVISNALEQYKIDKENQEAADAVVRMINEIDEVTLEDKYLLHNINLHYTALTEEQKQYVSNYYTYSHAQEKYNELLREYMDEQTKDDPTRDIVLSDLNGTWECSDYIIKIADLYTDSHSVWMYTYNKNTGFDGIGGFITESVPSSILGNYDSITQTKSGKLYHWNSLFCEWHDFTVFIDSTGNMILKMDGYTYTKVIE